MSNPRKNISDPFVKATPQDISSLIGDYVTNNEEDAILNMAQKRLADEKDLTPASVGWNNQACFFESLEQRSDALKNALGLALISGDIPKAEILLNNNPWLFDEAISGVDQCGRCLTEKPIAFVARLYDFNPRQPEEKEEDFGAVERLSKIAIEEKKRTRDAIAAEVDAVLPCDWESMTDERMAEYGMDAKARSEMKKHFLFPWQAISAKNMQKYKKACEDLVDDLAKMEIPNNLTLQEILALPDVQALAQKFNDAIKSEGDRPPPGLLFDPAIFAWFFDQFCGSKKMQRNQVEDVSWRRRLGDEDSLKSNLLSAIGYDGLIYHNTACGQQIHLESTADVISLASPWIADRAINFFNDAPKNFPDFNIYPSLKNRNKMGLSSLAKVAQLHNTFDLFERLSQNKNSSLLSLFPPNIIRTKKRENAPSLNLSNIKNECTQKLEQYISLRGSISDNGEVTLSWVSRIFRNQPLTTTKIRKAEELIELLNQSESLEILHSVISQAKTDAPRSPSIFKSGYEATLRFCFQKVAEEQNLSNAESLNSMRQAP